VSLPQIHSPIQQRPFFGNVAAYWNRYGREIEAVEVAMAVKAGP
jgi:hypothetical protein